MRDPTAYEGVERLVRSFAWRVHRRLRAAGGRALDIDDIIQELNVAYLIARDRWDAQKGVPFPAYLMRGMRFHINRWTERTLEFQHNTSLALDSTAEDSDSPIHEIIPDTAPSPFNACADKQALASALNRMSSMTRHLVELAIDMPPELRAEFLAIHAKRDWAKTLSITAPISMTELTVIMDALDINRVQRMKIYKELREISVFFILD